MRAGQACPASPLAATFAAGRSGRTRLFVLPRRTSAFDRQNDTVTITLDEPSGATRTLAFVDIDKARTTFEWGPAPKPGGPKPNTKTPSTPTKKKKVQP